MTFENIFNTIYDDCLKIVLTVISLVVSYYVIPTIKNDLIPYLKEQRIYSTIKKFVKAAEKLAESGLIQKVDKKKYVIDLLKENGITITPTLEAFIESCCKEIDIIVNSTKNEILNDENVEP